MRQPGRDARVPGPGAVERFAATVVRSLHHADQRLDLLRAQAVRRLAALATCSLERRPHAIGGAEFEIADDAVLEKFVCDCRTSERLHELTSIDASCR
jgi:hypothetical protein